LPRGVILATCQVIDVCPTVQKDLIAPPLLGSQPDSGLDGWTPAPHEHVFGDFTAGRFAWLLDHVTPLPKPIPA